MKVTYDPKADAVYIRLTTEKRELHTHLLDDPWVAVDIDSNRQVVGFEILAASARIDLEQLKTLDFIEFGEPLLNDSVTETAAIREQKLNYTSAQSK